MANQNLDSDALVSYTVKELLGQIIHRLDEMDAKLDLTAPATRVDSLDRRVNKLETYVATREALSKWQKWFFGLIGAGVFGICVELIRIVVGH